MENNHGHKSHGIMMILCCLIPIILLGILFSLNIGGPTFKTIIGGLFILACPLGHILMMAFMGGHDHGNHQDGQQQNGLKEEGASKSCH